MIILPAIIPDSVEHLESLLFQVKGLVRNVQIDICDGRLTPVPSWPYVADHGEFAAILGQERGLPLWEFFDFEIDLMVLNPAKEYEKWIDAGASRLIFHFLEREKEILKEIMQKTKDRAVEVGLALNLSDPLELIEFYKDHITQVQFMGIKNIGFQGEPFDKEVIERVKQTKALYPDLIVSVDGGVNADTAHLLVDAKVDRLVIGSAIFGNPDSSEAVGYFKSLGY